MPLHMKLARRKSNVVLAKLDLRKRLYPARLAFAYSPANFGIQWACWLTVTHPLGAQTA